MSELPSSGGLDLYPSTDAPTPPRSSRPPSITLNWEEPEKAVVAGGTAAVLVVAVLSAKKQRDTLKSSLWRNRPTEPVA